MEDFVHVAWLHGCPPTGMLAKYLGVAFFHGGGGLDWCGGDRTTVGCRFLVWGKDKQMEEIGPSHRWGGTRLL